MAMLLALAIGQLLEFGVAVGVFPYENQDWEWLIELWVKETGNSSLRKSVSWYYIHLQDQKGKWYYFIAKWESTEEGETGLSGKNRKQWSATKRTERLRSQTETHLLDSHTEEKAGEMMTQTQCEMCLSCPGSLSPINSACYLKASTFKLLLKIPLILS